MPHWRCVFLGLWLIAHAATTHAADELASEPLFSRHVVPLFSRLGCNAGACHGAVKGQNGFRLSLFGADPTADHERIVREVGGRRLNTQAPDSSLLLLKATGRSPHQGGRRMVVSGFEHEIVRRWIVSGALLDTIDASRVVRLSVEPASQTVALGERSALQVTAQFVDGSTENVTRLCAFESANRDVAQVDASGQVTAVGVGDAAIIARYRAAPITSLMIVPRGRSEPFPDVEPFNFIDRHVLDKLRRLNIHPAGLCDDGTFLRRASLDVAGELPTPDEIQAFLADSAPDKRQKKIEELLSRPGHAAVWTTKLCDLLRPTGFEAKFGFSEAAESRRVYEWLRARMIENTPYDELAERVLLATSLDGRPAGEWVQEVRRMGTENSSLSTDLAAYTNRRTLDLYWQRTNATGVKGTLQVAHAFLGLRMECAQCHRHPHDVWQQDDLLSFANFFMQVNGPGGSGSSPPLAAQSDALTNEAKALRETAKKLGEQAKDKSLAKDELARLNAEAKTLNDNATVLESAGRRIKGTEVHSGGKPAFASVTSPLGKQESKQLRLLGASTSAEVPGGEIPGDLRRLVVIWMRRPDNPYFARAIVNRVWAHYFGRGIIDPPDHLSPLNPATHPELLAELCRDFIEHRYDFRHLHRTILSSRTYQQSAQTNATSRADTTNYASSYLRRLPAEVLVDALNHATAGTETYPPELQLPAGTRAIEVAGGVGGDRGRASLQYAFQIFGRPMRNPEVQCDCERDAKPTIVQTLYLANHPAVQAKISSPQGRVAEVLKTVEDDGRRIDTLFLWSLGRTPTDEERQAVLKHVHDSPTPQRGFEDLLWSLLNTREFLLNH